MYSGQSPRRIATIALAVTLTAATAGTAFAAPNPDDVAFEARARHLLDQAAAHRTFPAIWGTTIDLLSKEFN